MSRLIKVHVQLDGSPVIEHPRPERLVRGNPLRHTWHLVQAKQPAGDLYCGLRTCGPGRWRIAMGPHEHELFTVVAGLCRVHDALGGHEEIKPGEGLYIPPGFEGEFEVLEALTQALIEASARDLDQGNSGR